MCFASTEKRKLSSLLYKKRISSFTEGGVCLGVKGGGAFITKVPARKRHLFIYRLNGTFLKVKKRSKLFQNTVCRSELKLQ